MWLHLNEAIIDLMNSNSKPRFGFPPAREVYFPDEVCAKETNVLLEDRFFRGICLPNGTYKTTGTNRLHEIDDALCRFLKDTRKDLEILDVGVSSGVTSLELVETMTQQGFKPRLTAVDITIHAFLSRLPGGIDVLCESKGHILQIACPLFVKGRPHQPFSSLLRAILQSGIVILEALMKMGVFRCTDTKPVMLVSPRLLDKPEITIAEHDLNDDKPEWHGQFDVVRAANILNEAYFGRPVLKKMLGYLCSYVRPNGFLVLVQTLESDNSNHGTIFTLSADGKFSIACRIGDGHGLESLAHEVMDK